MSGFSGSTTNRLTTVISAGNLVAGLNFTNNKWVHSKNWYSYSYFPQDNFYKQIFIHEYVKSQTGKQDFCTRNLLVSIHSLNNVIQRHFCQL